MKIKFGKYVIPENEYGDIGIIDEDDLYNALINNIFAGASLDVIVEDVIVSGSNNEQVSIDIFSDANDKVTFTIYKKDDQGDFVECNDIFGRYQDVNLEEDNENE